MQKKSLIAYISGIVLILGISLSYPYWESYINPTSPPIVTPKNNQDKQQPPNSDPQQNPDNKNDQNQNPEQPPNGGNNNNGGVNNTTQEQPVPEQPKQTYPQDVTPVSNIGSSMMGNRISIRGTAHYTGKSGSGDKVFFRFDDVYGNGSIKLVVFDALGDGAYKVDLLKNNNVVTINGKVGRDPSNNVIDVIVNYVNAQ